MVNREPVEAWPLRTLLALAACTGGLAVAVMTWRWGGTIEDSQAYFDTVRFLRGELTIGSLRAPFPYRIGVPGLVALLPFDARAAFASVNLLCDWASSVLATATAATVVRSKSAVWAGGLLAVLNFATFWYAPFLLVDPGSLLARSLFVFGVISGNRTLMAGSAFVGTIIREENILLSGWLLLTGRLSFVRAVALVLVSAGWLIFVRWYLIQGLPPYRWSPHLAQVWAALCDLRSVASIVATCGVVVPLAIFGWRAAPDSLRPLESLLLLLALPALYALFCVRIDGRVIWGLYPMLIPFAVCGVQRFQRSHLLAKRAHHADSEITSPIAARL